MSTNPLSTPRSSNSPTPFSRPIRTFSFLEGEDSLSSERANSPFRRERLDEGGPSRPLRTYTQMFLEDETSRGSTPRTISPIVRERLERGEVRVEIIRAKYLHYSQAVLDILMLECPDSEQYTQMSQLVFQLEGKGGEIYAKVLTFLKQVLTQRSGSPDQQLLDYVEALEVMGDTRPRRKLLQIHDFLVHANQLDAVALETVFAAGEPLVATITKGEEKLEVYKALICAQGMNIKVFDAVDQVLDLLEPTELTNSRLVTDFLTQIASIKANHIEPDMLFHLARLFIPKVPSDNKLEILTFLSQLSPTDLEQMELFKEELQTLGKVYALQDVLIDFIAIPENKRVDALMDVEKVAPKDRAFKFYKMRIRNPIDVSNKIFSNKSLRGISSLASKRLLFIGIAALPERYRDRGIALVTTLLNSMQPADYALSFYALTQTMLKWDESYYNRAEMIVNSGILERMVDIKSIPLFANIADPALLDTLLKNLKPLLLKYQNNERLQILNYFHNCSSDPYRIVKLSMIALHKSQDLPFTVLKSSLEMLATVEEWKLNYILHTMNTNNN